MVILKNKSELEAMKHAGLIAANALQVGGKAVQAGISTKEIDQIIHNYIIGQGATPSFLGYGGFPASSCISINEVVIHGIPGERIVREGDVVSIDVGAFFEGFHGDNAATFACGSITPEARQLLDVTNQCLFKAIDVARVGNRMGDISNAVESLALEYNYGVVKDFVGHGIGRDMHEDPQVPNYGSKGRGVRLEAGMTLAIEPMITMGTDKVKVLEDEWTVVTLDKSIVAHFEHTIAITEDGPIILTKPGVENV